MLLVRLIYFLIQVTIISFIHNIMKKLSNFNVGFIKRVSAKTPTRLRYIKQFNMDPSEFVVDYEISSHINLIEPTLFCGFFKKPCVVLTGRYAPDKFIYLDKLSSNIVVARLKTPKEQEAGTIFVSKGVGIIILHIKPDMISSAKAKKVILATIIRTLRSYGMPIEKRVNPHNHNTNDLVIKTKDGDKKFCGICPISQGKWMSYGLPITFEMDYEEMRRIFKLNTTKMKEKGEVKDIKEVVVGLDEIKKVDRNLFFDDFAKNLAERLSLELMVSDYSDKEREVLKKMLPIVASEDWVYKAKRKDL